MSTETISTSTVSFFTPISFGDQKKSCVRSMLEATDRYFYLGGRKAYVIPGDAKDGLKEAVLLKDSPAFLATVFKVFKVISYFTMILPVIMLVAKVILRSTHSFRLVDAQTKLEEDLKLSKDTKEKIEKLMPKILEGKDVDKEKDPDIIWHVKRGHNYTFTLKPGLFGQQLGLIFKMAIPGVGSQIPGRGHVTGSKRTEDLFANMVKAQAVCLAYQLDRLKIPPAQKFNIEADQKLNIEETPLIAEEYQEIQHNESAQEEQYQLSGLDDNTLKQLVKFIAKTGLSHVTWRHMPIAKDKQVVLIDLEEMEDAVTGIFGDGDRRRGLIGCLFSKEQIMMVVHEAIRLGIIKELNPNQKELIEKKFKEIEREDRLKKFYVDKGIWILDKDTGIPKDPRQKIKADLTSLGLTDEQGTGVSKKPKSLKNVVDRVVDHINTLIKNAPEEVSTKSKRFIKFDITTSPLQKYHHLGVPAAIPAEPQSTDAGSEQVSSSKPPEVDDKRWIKRIIDALYKKGHLFSVEVTGHEYSIQA